MRPLILEYAEEPNCIEFDNSIIEYSEKKNLTVIRDTEVSAISQVSMETETFTKTQGEPSDSDSDLRNELKILMGTETRSYSPSEPTDSDRDISSLNVFMGTRTITESVEPTDSDR